MRLRLLVPIVTVLLATPAYAYCTDDVCGSLQKILAARSGNFAKLKGKTAIDPRGDPIWDGTQPIAGLINACHIYKRGEGVRYEYRCDFLRLRNAAVAIGRKGEANRRQHEAGVAGRRSDTGMVR